MLISFPIKPFGASLLPTDLKTFLDEFSIGLKETRAAYTLRFVMHDLYSGACNRLHAQ
jgi:hypothetical protein